MGIANLNGHLLLYFFSSITKLYVFVTCVLTVVVFFPHQTSFTIWTHSSQQKTQIEVLFIKGAQQFYQKALLIIKSIMRYKCDVVQEPIVCGMKLRRGNKLIATSSIMIFWGGVFCFDKIIIRK